MHGKYYETLLDVLAVVQKPTSGSQNVNVVIVGIIGLIVVLVVVTLFANKK